MIQNGNKKERHALPRWNSIETAEKLGELGSARIIRQPQHSFSASELTGLLGEWKNEKNLPLAVEIISAAKLSQSEEDISDVVQFAKKAILNIQDTNPLLKELIFDSPTRKTYETDTHQVSIEKIKKSLVEYPRNPLLWSELSREYTILGQEQKSKKAIQVAFALAPENRTVLRAISRFYAHIGDIEQASFYLRNSPLIKSDPWILSAEIALSNESGRTSRNIKHAQKMILDANYHPLALSELASELGTMDFLAGNNRQGKRKLEVAVKQPHENAVAQIAWINKNTCNVEAIISGLQTPACNFEAETRWFFDAEEWKKALDVSGRWQEYQPFSREPAIVSSFIATDFLMDYKKAEETLRCGLKSNPNDCNLLNNYIYVLALDDQLTQAMTVLERAQRLCNSSDNISLIATSGLLCYRLGNPDLGRQQYLSAIDAAKKINDQDSHYRAILCLAREEKRQGNSIVELMKQIEDPKYAFLHKQYETLIQNFKLV